MKKTSPEIHELKKQLEGQLKRKMKTPRDTEQYAGHSL